jgi:hypothetical protein
VHLHRGDIPSWIIRWNGNRGRCPRPRSGKSWATMVDPTISRAGNKGDKRPTFIDETENRMQEEGTPLTD